MLFMVPGDGHDILPSALVSPKGMTKYSMSDGCGEGSLPAVTFSDADEMVSVAEVELREDHGPLQEFKGRRDKRQRVVILVAHRQVQVVEW